MSGRGCRSMIRGRKFAGMSEDGEGIGKLDRFLVCEKVMERWSFVVVDISYRLVESLWR